jgi:hypothetical protein
LNETSEAGGTNVTFKKTQLPQIGAIPYFNLKDLFFNQKTRTGRGPTRIKLTLETSVAPTLSFEIYPAFSRNIMVDGKGQTISKTDYIKLSKLKPVYIPSTIGIVVREELFRPIYQDRLIAEGRHNLILRNLVYRLSKTKHWVDYCRMIENLFHVREIRVPFDDSTDEWLTSQYKEEGEFDFLSAGSGFIQVANILAFLFLNPTNVVLIDEPDSHMHDDLQRLMFDILKQTSLKKGLQIIVATHSPTFIDSSDLESLMIINRKEECPIKPQNVGELIPILGDLGLALPPSKIVSTLRSKKVLFVEGKESDYENFIRVLGNKIYSDFAEKTRLLTIFQTEGATKEWPLYAIDIFEKLVGSGINYVYIRDRDFHLDHQIMELFSKIKNQNHKVIYLEHRNRESYLINPHIISKLLVERWENNNKRKNIPDCISDDEIKKFILKEVRDDEHNVRACLMVFHDQYLKAEASEKHKRIIEINTYFDNFYNKPISMGEIPFRLMDSKKVLKSLRKHVAEKVNITFSDKEVLTRFEKKDIAPGLQAIIRDIYEM